MDRKNEEVFPHIIVCGGLLPVYFIFGPHILKSQEANALFLLRIGLQYLLECPLVEYFPHNLVKQLQFLVFEGSPHEEI